MAENGLEINERNFHLRFSELYRFWRESLKAQDETFNGAEVLAICTGKADDGHPYIKSTISLVWLFGYQFSDTLVLITREKFIIVAGQKKIALIEPLKAQADHHGHKIETIVKNRGDNAKEKIEEAYALAKEKDKDRPIKFGSFPKDKHEGPFYDEWANFLKEKKIEIVDISIGISDLLATKDEDALNNIRLNCEVTKLLLRRYVVDRMETIIDEEKKITHSKFSEEIDNFLTNPKSLKKIKAPEEVSTDYIDWAYTPIIQSGGTYDLRPSATSNDDVMHFGTIVISLGTRYKSFCGNMARTFLIAPTKQQEENYNILVECQQVVIDSLKVGALVRHAYENAIKFLEKKKPELIQFFLKNCGFGMGLEYRESNFVINAKNDQEIQEGMIFNVIIGFQNLENSAANGKEKIYSLLLSDTVEISKLSNQILTNYPKALEVISYFFDDNKETEKESSSSSSKPKEKEKEKERAEGHSKAILETRTRGDENLSISKEQERKERQQALFEARVEEAKQRYSGSKNKKSTSQVVTKKPESYKKLSDFPEVRFGKIIIDERRETVILPVFGFSVPFHIAMLKNPSLTKADEKEGSYLRINFVTPGQAGSKDLVLGPNEPESSFLREITYRSSDSKLLEDAFKAIKELKKKGQEREQRRKEQEDLVEQADLILIKEPPRLVDVYIRPTLEGKRNSGFLLIHKNGLRYQTTTGRKVDILFSNIKHLFFQPCDKEVVILIHVHLKNPIMLDKKKTRDIQFFREVVDSAVDETGNRRRNVNFMDKDEIEAEQDEKRQRKRQNKEFQSFSKKIADLSDGLVELDEPFRDLGFFGVPFRSNVLLQPTTYALVHLTEPPFFIVTMSDVELAHFERIEHGLKNFDLVFVFKDYKKTPVHVNSIPMQQLENVKEWIDESDIPFTESKINLNWGPIMKHINEDPLQFFEEGGWEFLLPESDAEEERSESGSEFEPSGESSEEDSISEDSDDDSDSASSEGSDFETPSESEGEDWSDLEREAAKEDDRKRVREETSDNESAPKKKKR